jgi:ADP-ribosylglycohydrolase
MTIPTDYEERVYAGVLGKIIGVYLGRPVEGWTMEQIAREVGEIWYYVNDQRDYPLIITDDDITGTFTFVRALRDYADAGLEGRNVTAAQIGRTWLNYLIENRTILWWGGMGNSTEHTAYLRLKAGIEAPRSGSAQLNSQVVAEQIGAQIFIDGWAMVAPGDPGLAADLARRAASVSHDGEAVFGAQVIAAMEAQAFVENDLDRLLDVGVSFIPKDSIIFRMISDIRGWRAHESDWRAAFARLASGYGYEKYGGNCHMVPNHGLIIMSLLYGDNDFQKTMMIVNTCGWDTDCNSGNVGCLMGIKNGLAGLDSGPDYRGPVADRLFLPTADGGRAITDAVVESYHLINTGRAFQGAAPIEPKGGARYHFDLPGAVQGFRPEGCAAAHGDARTASQGREIRDICVVENVAGHSKLGSRCLAIRYRGVARNVPARVSTATFVPPEATDMPGYGLMCSPTLYPGQTVRGRVVADESNEGPVNCRLFVRAYGAEDRLVLHSGAESELAPGQETEFSWRLPALGGAPIAEIGLEISSPGRADGSVYLDYLGWSGEPDVVLTAPKWGGEMWRRAWVNGIDWEFSSRGSPFRLVQNDGTGLLMQGTREWRDYRVSADVSPHFVKSAGVAARVQGMRRYYAVLLCSDGYLRVMKMLDSPQVLAEIPYAWELDHTYRLALEVDGRLLRATVDGREVYAGQDVDHPLQCGAVALVCEEGRTETKAVCVEPLSG